ISSGRWRWANEDSEGRTRACTIRACVGVAGRRRASRRVSVEPSRAGELELHRRGAGAVRLDRADPERSAAQRRLRPDRDGERTAPESRDLPTRPRAGIWVNVDSRVFDNVPAYLAVLANRPLDMITNAETLRRLQLGLANVVLQQRAAVTIADSSPDDPFRLAFLKLRQKQQLYQEASNGITFLTPTLYRATIPLPAESPVGDYEIDVRLFADGAAITRTNSAFEVYKTGIEQLITSAARDHSLVYGLTTAMMALLTGWLASIVFRRD